MISAVINVKMENEDKRLNMSYGLIPPSSKKDKNQILLDIDLFFINQNVEIKSIESKWEQINTEIFNIHTHIPKKNNINICTPYHTTILDIVPNLMTSALHLIPY